MRLISTALLLVSLGFTGCAPDTADSGPSYPGWALEAGTSGETFLLEAGDSRKWSLDVESTGVPCEGCTVEQQAQIAVTVDIQTVDAPSELQVALIAEGLRVGRENVLLVGPVFQGCRAAPKCREELQLELVSDAAVRGSWSVTARAESMHDAEKWEHGATLGVRLK